MKKTFIIKPFAAIFGVFAMAAVLLQVSCSNQEMQSESRCHKQSEIDYVDQLYYFEKYFASVHLMGRNVELVLTDGSIKYLNTTEEDRNVCLLMIQKIDNHFQVMAWDQNDGSFLGLGLIPDDTFLYVYIRVPLGVVDRTFYEIDLYETPDYNGNCRKASAPNSAYIVDVYGTWIKIKYTISGVDYQGWIPKELQCGYTYPTCN